MTINANTRLVISLSQHIRDVTAWCHLAYLPWLSWSIDDDDDDGVVINPIRGCTSYKVEKAQVPGTSRSQEYPQADVGPLISCIS